MSKPIRCIPSHPVKLLELRESSDTSYEELEDILFDGIDIIKEINPVSTCNNVLYQDREKTCKLYPSHEKRMIEPEDKRPPKTISCTRLNSVSFVKTKVPIPKADEQYYNVDDLFKFLDNNPV